MNLTLTLPPAAVQQLLQILGTAPLPHAVSNPLIQTITQQAQQQIQAAQAPAAAAEPSPEPAAEPSRASRRTRR